MSDKREVPVVLTEEESNAILAVRRGDLKLMDAQDRIRTALNKGEREQGEEPATLRHERNFWSWKHSRRVEEILQLREELPSDSPNHLEPRICTGCLLTVDDLEGADTLAPVTEENGEEAFACAKCRDELGDNLTPTAHAEGEGEQVGEADLKAAYVGRLEEHRDQQAEELTMIALALKNQGIEDCTPQEGVEKLATLYWAYKRESEPDRFSRRVRQVLGSEEAVELLVERIYVDDPTRDGWHEIARGHLAALTQLFGEGAGEKTTIEFATPQGIADAVAESQPSEVPEQGEGR